MRYKYTVDTYIHHIPRGNHYLSVRLEPRIIVNYGTCARDRPDGSRISGNDLEDSRDE